MSEQKKLDRPELGEKIERMLDELLFVENGKPYELTKCLDSILALIEPLIEEKQEWYDKLLAEFKTLKRERANMIEEAKKQEGDRIKSDLEPLIAEAIDISDWSLVQGYVRDLG